MPPPFSHSEQIIPPLLSTFTDLSHTMLCFTSNPLFLFSYSLLLLAAAANGQLQFGFYAHSCSAAEQVVSNVVQQASLSEPRTAARLLRLSFHDCFVEGCDGSILLDGGERGATGNQGLGSFDVIETAKERLESMCPGIVSCADIVALAARDAIALSRGPIFDIPTGRRDGRVNDVNNANSLPDVNDSADVMIDKFRQKGLSVRDLVLLTTGGHTIGTTACFFMEDRLYHFRPPTNTDPTINPQLLPQLEAQCPKGGDINARLKMDWSTPDTMDDQIIRNIQAGFAVLASDARLADNKEAVDVMNSYLSTNNATAFLFDFAEAMVKMGTMGVKTGAQGEIRRRCNLVN
ncbi:Peroxidase 13 [Linum grandiflorum]